MVNTFDLQWGYLSAFIMAYLVAVLNMYPLRYKRRIMKGGNLMANM